MSYKRSPVHIPWHFLPQPGSSLRRDCATSWAILLNFDGVVARLCDVSIGMFFEMLCTYKRIASAVDAEERNERSIDDLD